MICVYFLTKAKQHALKRLQQEIEVIERLAPLEMQRFSRERKKKLEQAHSAFRTHCPTFAIPVPHLGTFYTPVEYLKNAQIVATAIAPLGEESSEQEKEGRQEKP